MSNTTPSSADRAKSFGIGALGLGVLGIGGFFVGEKFSAPKVTPAAPPAAVSVEKSSLALPDYVMKQREILSREVVLTDEIRNPKGEVISRSNLYRTYEQGSTPFTYMHSPLSFTAQCTDSEQRELEHLTTSPEYCARLERRVQQEVLGASVALDDIKVVGPKIVSGQAKERARASMPDGVVVSDINSEQIAGQATTESFRFPIYSRQQELGHLTGSYVLEVWDGSLAYVTLEQSLELVANALSSLKTFSGVNKNDPEAVKKFLLENKESVASTLTSTLTTAVKAERILTEHEAGYKTWLANLSVTVLNRFLDNGRVDPALVAMLMGDKGRAAALLSGAQSGGVNSSTNDSMETDGSSQVNDKGQERTKEKQFGFSQEIGLKVGVKGSAFFFGGNVESEVKAGAHQTFADRIRQTESNRIETHADRTISNQIAKTENTLRELGAQEGTEISVAIKLDTKLTYSAKSIAPTYTLVEFPMYKVKDLAEADTIIQQHTSVGIDPHRKVLDDIRTRIAQIDTAMGLLDFIGFAQTEIDVNMIGKTQYSKLVEQGLPKSIPNPLDGITRAEAKEILNGTYVDPKWETLNVKDRGRAHIWAAEGLREKLNQFLDTVMIEIDSQVLKLGELQSNQMQNASSTQIATVVNQSSKINAWVGHAQKRLKSEIDAGK